MVLTSPKGTGSLSRPSFLSSSELPCIVLFFHDYAEQAETAVVYILLLLAIAYCAKTQKSTVHQRIRERTKKMQFFFLKKKMKCQIEANVNIWGG